MPYFKTFEKQSLADGYSCVVGIDEVGRGSIAGPLVVGCVKYNDYLQKLRGLNDSKKMKAFDRELLAKKISLNCEFGLGICWPEEIDNLGMAACLRLCVDRAISASNVLPDFLYLDGYLKGGDSVDSINIVKGDSKVRSIAAASIVAKVYRDQLMKLYKSLYNQFCWDSHKGYGTKQHVLSISRNGHVRIHRESFLTKILDEKDTTCR